MHTRLTRACFNTTCLSNMLDAVPFILAFLNQDGSFKHITSIPGNRTQTESPATESSFPKHSWQGLCSMGRTVNSIEIQPFLLVQSQMSCLEHWHLMVVLKSYFISLTCSDNHQWILENPKWIPYRSHINPMNYWMITPWHTTLFCHKKKLCQPHLAAEHGPGPVDCTPRRKFPRDLGASHAPIQCWWMVNKHIVLLPVVY